MKYLLSLVATSFFCTHAFAFKQEDVEKLRNTGSCNYCDLSRFNFPNRANLNGANLENADLENANLSGANLSGANLENTNLSGADLTNAKGMKRF